MSEGRADDHLIAEAVGGNRSALKLLLVSNLDRVVAIIARKLPADLRGVVSAEDVCQDACVAAFEQIATLQGRDERSFFRWLQTIAENKLTDAIRAERAAKRGGGRKIETQRPDCEASSVVDLLGLLAVHERTPSRSAARRELILGVQTALDDLKEEQRQAIRLRYVERMSVTQTAERMERTGRAVEMLCHRGLRRLEQVIGDPARFLSRKG
jgi:RNA polymerase sigma-70 factor (ECF subfamily)